MTGKERNERHDIPAAGALILIHGRVHEVMEAWEATGTGLGERGGWYTCHDPGDGSAPSKHVYDAGRPWRPATGQPWDEERTTPAERALRIQTLAHHADRDALQAVLEAGALALVKSGHESPTVERLAAAIAGTFDTHPPEFGIDRKVHLLNGDEARVVGRYLNGYGKWEYMVRHGDGSVWQETDGHLFQAWIRWTQPKMRPLQDGGSLFSGAELRGPQTVEVAAADQGAGLQSIQISVNGTGAAGDDLSGSCNPLPGALTSRLVPCPLSFSKTYTLDTAQPPFKDGMNTVQVCAYDYAQTGTPNSACTTHEVLVNNLCPGSSVAGGKTITAGFAGNKKTERTLSFHRKALIRGRLVDSNGQPVAGAQVCIQAHTDLEGRPFHLVATTTTNQNGGWSYKTNRGPSRIFRVGYRSGAFETSIDLTLHIRSRSTLHLSTHRTPIHKKVYFSGELPGPSCAGRTVYVSGTVPGAKRRFLVRQATTDALCHFRKGYAFSPIPRASRFVFWVNVPEQAGYPYRPGRSVNRYLRVSPHPPKQTKKSR